MFDNYYKKYGDEFNWYIPNDLSSLETQLNNELSVEHELFSERLVAVAKSTSNDDVLFTNGKHYFIVHLTWCKGNGTYPLYEKTDTLEQALMWIEKMFLTR